MRDKNISVQWIGATAHESAGHHAADIDYVVDHSTRLSYDDQYVAQIIPSNGDGVDVREVAGHPDSAICFLDGRPDVAGGLESTAPVNQRYMYDASNVQAMPHELD